MRTLAFRIEYVKICVRTSFVLFFCFPFTPFQHIPFLIPLLNPILNPRMIG